MQHGLRKSSASRYKTSFAVFLIITFTAGCAHWMRYLDEFSAAIVEEVNNRSKAIFTEVLSGYNVSSNTATVTDLTTAPPEGRAVNKTGRYVSMSQGNFDGRRVGNQLFNFAAMLHIARLTGRRVAMLRHHPYGWLDRWFEVPVTRVDNINTELCPCVTVGEAAALAYHKDIPKLSNRTDITGKSLLVSGWFQSWKYTLGVESALRHHLRLLPNVSAAVHAYLDQIWPSAWIKTRQFVSRIAIHVRAGDLISREKRREKWSFGYTIPQRPYFEQAMSRFIDKLKQQQQGEEVRVQFIVTSDSLAWVKSAINFTSIAHQFNEMSTKNKVVVNVAHSEHHEAGFDLALISLCDGVIMSTGTYGWWGAWLANKTTIYYSNWPRVHTPLFGAFKREDFFPRDWIPIDGPAFPCC